MHDIKVAIAGVGSRGRHTYGNILQSIDNAHIVALADINNEALSESAKQFNVASECCFSSAEELLKQPKLADVILICTPDSCHADQAVAALNKGYHLLLEKPIATSLADCKRVHRAAVKSGKSVVVCHVLRYTPFYGKIKELLDSCVIGEVVTLNALERVLYWHQAHSFVRGNWRNTRQSAPMILAKSCHDMDIIRWLMGRRCESVSSFGSLTHFKAENAPVGSTDRCKNCTADCIYNAYNFYMPQVKGEDTPWPANTLTPNLTEENVRDALDNGPYGRCVYRCDNDVVDHHTVNMLFEGGATATFTMTAFTATGNRSINIMGTLGEIRADMDTNIIEVLPFGKESRRIDINSLADNLSGHGGGDERMLKGFIAALSNDMPPEFTIGQSVESHYMAFAAEQSRLKQGKVIKL